MEDVEDKLIKFIYEEQNECGGVERSILYDFYTTLSNEPCEEDFNNIMKYLNCGMVETEKRGTIIDYYLSPSGISYAED